MNAFTDFPDCDADAQPFTKPASYSRNMWCSISSALARVMSVSFTAITIGTAMLATESALAFTTVLGSRTASSVLVSQVDASTTSSAGVAQLGESGPLVTELQRRLADLGFYSGPITGYFGELTQSAVIRFQQENQLVADGLVGPSTAEALRTYGSSPSEETAAGTLQLQDQGPAVTEVQTQLAELGYYDGPITGYFGSLTQDAVIQFQRSNGLTVDGLIGPATLAALQTAAQPPAPAPVPAADNGVLDRGDVGTDVTNLQIRLRDLGYYQGSISGEYGPLTEAAVVQFQRSQGLVADGIAGPVTLETLNNPSASAQSTSTVRSGAISPQAGGTATVTVNNPPAVAPSPTSQPGVLDLQRRLQDRGFYSGPLDGVLGPETRAAIDAAQLYYQLQGNDIID